MANHHAVVEELAKLIAEHHWEGAFAEAIRRAHEKNVPLLNNITNLRQYLDWIDAFLHWVPSETSSGTNVYNHLCAFYFIVDQEPLLSLQNKIVPYDSAKPLTPFSRWLVTYADAMGKFLDEAQPVDEIDAGGGGHIQRDLPDAPAGVMDQAIAGKSILSFSFWRK